MPRLYFVAASLAAVCTCATHSVAQLGFMGLGSEEGATFVEGISGDGSVVVGWGFTATGIQGFRWMRETGRVPVPVAPGFEAALVLDITGDARSMAGRLLHAGGTEGRAAVWTDAGMPQPIVQTQSVGRGISDDGLVVVGGVFGAGDQAFRWTQEGGVALLGTLPGRVFSAAVDTSADGGVVIGNAYNPAAQTDRAFRWTSATGMVDIGTLAGRSTATATGVSADGSTIVGTSAGGGVAQAFRWTAADGMVALPLPDGIVSSSASAISRDGSVVGGSISIGGPDHAFFWDASGGHELRAVLGDLVPDDWTLISIDAISDDGRTFAGRGMHGTRMEGWVATIPAPGAASVWGGALFLSCRRPRRRGEPSGLLVEPAWREGACAGARMTREGVAARWRAWLC